MKSTKILLLTIISLLSFSFQPITAQNQKKNKTEKKEVKLSVDQKLEIMTKELHLTAKEQEDVKTIFETTKAEKKKIKDMNLQPKEEKRKIDKVKDIQKEKLKKILGSKRYEKYSQLKKKDIL